MVSEGLSRRGLLYDSGGSQAIDARLLQHRYVCFRASGGTGTVVPSVDLTVANQRWHGTSSDMMLEINIHK